MNDFAPSDDADQMLADLGDDAGLAEEAGFDSVFVLQHYLSNLTTLQPMPLLAYLAATTSRIRLGTNIVILPLAHPVALAEDLATVNHLCGGRLIAGFGMGYRENEFRSFRVGLDERVARFESSVRLLRDLWSGAEVTATGASFDLHGERMGAPVPADGIPIWVGAGPHRTGARRAAELGDAWILPPQSPPAKLAGLLETYREASRAAGRGEGRPVIRRDVYLDRDHARAEEEGNRIRAEHLQGYQQLAANPFASGDSAAPPPAVDSYVFGSPAYCVERLAELAELGIEDVVIRLRWPRQDRSSALRSLDLFHGEVMSRMTPS